jgi:hypothetical protein
MARVADSIHADTGSLRQIADQLDPSAVAAAKAAAAEVRGTVRDCGDPLPGCQQLNVAVIQVTDQITAFCTEVEEGVRAYASAALDSASGYEDADGTGRASIKSAVPSLR